MMLRYSLNQVQAADRIESAVSAVLSQGLRTADIWSEGTKRVGTREMGDAVVAALSGTSITPEDHHGLVSSGPLRPLWTPAQRAGEAGNGRGPDFAN